MYNNPNFELIRGSLLGQHVDQIKRGLFEIRLRGCDLQSHPQDKAFTLEKGIRTDGYVFFPTHRKAWWTNMFNKVKQSRAFYLQAVMSYRPIKGH